MAIEDLTTWTEVDPSSDLTVTSSKVDVVTMLSNIDAYVHLAKSIDVADFSYDFEFELTSTTGTPTSTAMGVSTVVDDLGFGFSLACGWQGVTPYVLEYDDIGNLDTFTGGSSLSTATLYYCTMSRTGSSFDWDIYSDSSRATLVQNITLTILNNTSSYAQVYAMSSNNQGGSGTSTYYVQNVDFNEAALTLDYGEDNNSRYFDVDVSTTSLVLPDGDWCVGMWIRLPTGLLTTMDYQYVFSAGTIGASNSFHVFFGEASSFNDVVVRFNGATGTEVNQNVATAVGNVTTGINTDDHLMVIQRIGSTIYTYWVLEGDTVSGSTNSFSNNSNTANTFPSLNIGRRPDGNSTRYFGNVVGEVFILTSDYLTDSELTTLAAGAHIDAVRASPYLDLRFKGSNSTEIDQSGNGYNGTQNGTGWTLVNEFFPDTTGTTGTLNVTEANDTSTATANTEYIGTANNTEENDTSTATANTEYIGTANNTEANDTSTATANTEYIGTANNTEANDTSTATANTEYIGTANNTEANDTSTAAGTITSAAITGTAANTEDNDTSITVGTVANIGTLNVTEANDTSTTAGIAGDDISGAADNAVDNDTLTGIVTLTNIGTAANTEINDISTTVGTVANIGIVSITEDDDNPNFILLQGIGILGLVNTIDDNDTLSASVYAPPEHTALVYDITQIIDRTTSTYIANFENIEILTDTTSDAVDIILTNSNSTVEIR